MLEATMERNPDVVILLIPGEKVVIRETKRGPFGDVSRIWFVKFSKEIEEEMWTDHRCLKKE